MVEQRYTTTQPCQVHKIHMPRSHVNEVHHVWPLGMGGPDVLGNTIVSCATGHNSMHKLLKEWVKADGDPGWAIRRNYTPLERLYAKTGFERWKRGAL
jgi:hypothetical protein